MFAFSSFLLKLAPLQFMLSVLPASTLLFPAEPYEAHTFCSFCYMDIPLVVAAPAAAVSHPTIYVPNEASWNLLFLQADSLPPHQLLLVDCETNRTKYRFVLG